MRMRFFSGWSRSAVCCLALLSAAVMMTVAISLPGLPAARAQDADEKGDKAKDKDDGGGDKPAAKPADGKVPPKDQNLLAFYFGALGWFYSIAFLSLSFTLVALI